MSEVQVINQNQDHVLHDLRNLVETVGGDVNKLNGEQKSAYEKMNIELDKFEVKNQELSRQIALEKQERERLENEYKSLEARLCQPSFGSDQSATVEMKTFEDFIRKGFNGCEKKYLRTDSFAEGGALVPQDLEREIIKKITELSPVRSLAKIKQMGFKTKEIPTRSAIITCYWEGEGESVTSSNSTYGSEFLTARKLMAEAVITREELEDAGFNMSQEVANDIAESVAQKEGFAFVNGDGVKKPEGFMQDSRVSEINSGLASTISFDNFATLEGALKTGYKAVYGFNRRTLAVIRNLKDTAGAYIWRAGNLGAGIPNNINGTPYYEMPDMPDIGAGNYPVIYGDFLKGYLIGDRVGISVIRDDVTLASSDKVKFVYRKRVAGKVQLPEAFVKLKVSA